MECSLQVASGSYLELLAHWLPHPPERSSFFKKTGQNSSPCTHLANIQKRAQLQFQEKVISKYRSSFRLEIIKRNRLQEEICPTSMGNPQGCNTVHSNSSNDFAQQWTRGPAQTLHALPGPGALHRLTPLWGRGSPDVPNSDIEWLIGGAR
jgi:hypothetical protein